MQLKPRSQVGQTKTVNGKQYKLNDRHRWERLAHEAAHQADHLGESVTSWKVGKVLGGAIHAVAAQHGLDSEHAAIAAETVVQAATATALHAIKQQRSGELNPREVAAYFVAQAAAAYAGKYAHHGADLAVQSFHVEGMMHMLAPLIAGKGTGIGTVTAANRSGLHRRVVDAVVDKGKHDINLLTNYLAGLRKSDEMPPELSALIWDLFQAAVVIGSQSQPMNKSLYAIGGALYTFEGDRFVKAGKSSPGQLSLFDEGLHPRDSKGRFAPKSAMNSTDDIKASVMRHAKNAYYDGVPTLQEAEKFNLVREHPGSAWDDAYYQEHLDAYRDGRLGDHIRDKAMEDAAEGVEEGAYKKKWRSALAHIDAAALLDYSKELLSGTAEPLDDVDPVTAIAARFIQEHIDSLDDDDETGGKAQKFVAKLEASPDQLPSVLATAIKGSESWDIVAALQSTYLDHADWDAIAADIAKTMRFDEAIAFEDRRGRRGIYLSPMEMVQRKPEEYKNGFREILRFLLRGNNPSPALLNWMLTDSQNAEEYQALLELEPDLYQKTLDALSLPKDKAIASIDGL